jgi:sentrin-specific protease 8
MNSGQNRIVLSYNDSLLHESDLQLLDVGYWLNDQLISFFYEYFENEQFKYEKHLFAFVNPSIVQYLKLCSSLQEAEMCFLQPLDLANKEYIFFPINNNNDAQSAGGSHWSLLVYQKATASFYSFDSINGSNEKETRSFYNKFRTYFNTNQLKEAENFPKQSNSSDCGVYVLGATELIAKHVKEQRGQANEFVLDFSTLTPKFICSLRTQYKNIILSLAQNSN